MISQAASQLHSLLLSSRKSHFTKRSQLRKVNIKIVFIQSWPNYISIYKGRAQGNNQADWFVILFMRWCYLICSLILVLQRNLRIKFEPCLPHWDRMTLMICNSGVIWSLWWAVLLGNIVIGVAFLISWDQYSNHNHRMNVPCNLLCWGNYPRSILVLTGQCLFNTTCLLCLATKEVILPQYLLILSLTKRTLMKQRIESLNLKITLKNLRTALWHELVMSIDKYVFE